MADRTLAKYEEPRRDDGPHHRLRIERSAAGAPGLFFTIETEMVDGSRREELTIVVEDGRALLRPVLEWLGLPTELVAEILWANSMPGFGVLNAGHVDYEDYMVNASETLDWWAESKRLEKLANEDAL